MLFAANKEDAPIFKERLLWLFFIAPFFFLLYGTANQIVSSYEGVPVFVYDWEKSIPFIAWMIVPYMFLDLFFGLSLLLPKTRGELQRHVMRLGFTITISALLFLIIPLQFSFAKPEVSGWLAPLFDALKNDLPYNQLPSLHVSLSMIVGYQFIHHSGQLMRWLYGIWFTLIILSILFVYQHHFIDIPGGILIGFLAFYLFPVRGRSRLPLFFVSPKHLGMAIKYLYISIVCTVLAFKLSFLWILFASLAISMLLLAIAYATGFNNLSQKKRGQVSWIFMVLFWPYYLGNILAWKYWRNKVTTFNNVDDQVYIGMSLAEEDHVLLRENNIKMVIDLAPELNSRLPDDVDYFSISLLDLAIPDPERLITIVEQIKQASIKGKVLVHCKLGLSRSTLVAGAWLIMNGYDKKDVWNKLKKIQPLSIDRPYMHIALELFEAELDRQRS